MTGSVPVISALIAESRTFVGKDRHVRTCQQRPAERLVRLGCIRS